MNYREIVKDYFNGMYTFEELLNMLEIKRCNNCQEYVLIEDMGKTPLAEQDGICELCVEEGYGK